MGALHPSKPLDLSCPRRVKKGSAVRSPWSAQTPSSTEHSAKSQKRGLGHRTFNYSTALHTLIRTRDEPHLATTRDPSTRRSLRQTIASNIFIELDNSYITMATDLPACFENHRNNVGLATISEPCGIPNSTHPYVTCCVHGDYCLADGICKYTHSQIGGSGYYLGDCTDSTFSDASCPKACSTLSSLMRPHDRS